MKCFVCGEGTLQSRMAAVEGEIRRKKYTVETPAFVCDACGHVALEGKDTQEFMRRVADAYRLENKLLTSYQIRRLRGHLSQLRFAEELGVGVASIKRWELGLIQDKRSDTLMRDFEASRVARYVYEEIATVSELCVAGSGPEGRAHSPPLQQELHAPILPCYAQ